MYYKPFIQKQYLFTNKRIPLRQNTVIRSALDRREGDSNNT